jgi:CheY-like chemotaxis protein
VSDGALSVLAVDDEVPQLEDPARSLRADRRVSDIETAASARAAFMKARGRGYDAVFLDVRRPELDGLELAKVLNAFTNSPALVPPARMPPRRILAGTRPTRVACTARPLTVPSGT